MDGTSKEVSSKETAEETWSSWALVIFLGIALTLLVFAIAIGFLAKMNSTAASQQRQGLELHIFFQYLPNQLARQLHSHIAIVVRPPSLKSPLQVTCDL